MEYQPPLDGLRAVAVTAVVLYHLGYSWARGGFLGVDTFFVLSGYLITTVLLVEWSGEDHIRLRRFWERRVRRLLPALVLLLAGVAIAAAVIVPATELGGLRTDSFASLFYVANWRFITSGQSYFDLFSAPSPLRHMWSLAIEEQFYLLWPPILLLTVRFARRARRALVAECVAGIVVSVALMAALYVPGDPSRVYYGTDTRVHTILVGCLLAIILHWSPAIGERARHVAAVSGAVSLGAILTCFVFVSEHSSALYHGGTLLFALAVVPIIAASAMIAPGVTRTLLSLRPLRLIGQLSYGIYLWHWPMIVWLTPDRVGASGGALDVLRIAATLSLATLSFYLVEKPIRRARFATVGRRLLAPAVVAIVVIALVGATSAAEPKPSYYGTGQGAASRCVPTVGEEHAVESFVTGTTPASVVRRVDHRVLLVGDSTACSLVVALQVVGATANLSVDNGTVIGCGVVADHFNEFTHFMVPCLDFATSVEGRAFSESRPDIVVWSSNWEREPLLVGGKLIAAGTPRWRRELLKRLESALPRFTAGGAHVVLLTQPPFADAAGALRHLPSAADVPFLRLNQVLKEFADGHRDKVTLVDLAAFVCPGTPPCPDSVHGFSPRHDGAHFTMQGAVWVARWLVPQLVKQP